MDPYFVVKYDNSIAALLYALQLGKKGMRLKTKRHQTVRKTKDST